MNCPHCKSVIEDDSYFCDQCGQEIMICPVCGTPGKGKRCTQDGKPLITAREYADGGAGGAPPASTTPTATGPAATVGTGPDTTAATGAAAGATTTTAAAAPSGASPTATGAPAPARGQLFLVNSNIGINLEIKPGQTIGRSSGEHAAIFGAYPMISGSHARIDGGQGWTVTDLGSTNGTVVNGQPVQPNTPVSLTDQGVVKFGNVEFIVRIVGAGPSGATPTVRM